MRMLSRIKIVRLKMITDDEINELIIMVSNEPSDAELRAFARAIAAKEREACAAIVDAEMDEWDDYDVNVALDNVAVEIRSR
jgi:hypothetical protein